MDAQEIKKEIGRLKASGATTYENCHMLVTLEKALKYMEEGGPDPSDGCMEDADKLTMQQAGTWVNSMKNADGSVGAHWTMEQTEQFRAQRGIDCSPVDFWVTMNMMYSDYCKAAKKNNTSTVDFFVDMAKAFLDDADARPGKLTLYYRYVSEH